MSTIILISGKQGSGKSTLQDALKSTLERDGRRRVIGFNFADTLYEMHNAVLEVMKGYGFETPIKDGVLLQLLGTEWGRKVYGQNIWVDILKRRIAQYNNRLHLVFVVADCRFRNEFDAFPEALRVRLTALEETRRVRTNSWRENIGHPSEIDLDGYEAEGKFDLIFDTTPGVCAPEHCAELILAQLQKQSWIEKRK